MTFEDERSEVGTPRATPDGGDDHKGERDEGAHLGANDDQRQEANKSWQVGYGDHVNCGNLRAFQNAVNRDSMRRRLHEVSSGAAVVVPDAGSLTPEQLALFSASDVSALTGSVVAVISPAQIAALAPAAFSGFTAVQTAQLSPDQVRAISAQAIAELTPSALQGLKRPVLRAFSAQQGAAISAAQVQELPVVSLVALSADALRAIPKAAVRAVPVRVLVGLSPTAANKLLNNMGTALSGPQQRALRLASRE